MDLAYLRAHPQHLPTFLEHQRIRETPVAGGDVARASRLTLDDGTSLFTKTWPGGTPPAGFFEAEAAGLSWLAAPGVIPVPEVLTALPTMIALEWIEPGAATRPAAVSFGRSLARLHRTGAPGFGASCSGFIGPLPLDNTVSAGPWGVWFGERRLRPYLRLSADRGALSPADVQAVEQTIKTLEGYEDSEPAARIHGDLWPGNILWSAEGPGWLIDPAAHGGHRETDLASLALFGGAPHLDAILGAYQDEHPLADGWQARVPLHQLHLLLVHTAAFGPSYAPAVRSAAASARRL
ncbi:fructosamine kinase family protein [Actinoplanes sp. NBRC 103695]|uniref:fructosamine kinase family protein n=1 Tax=Actinoplanes sp. NBRC 103695 TaxID=3032202 RepID=UPI0024A5946E|nr:fructosamine kinase family protein [Actinoplanes sp. NBRC 103695]GLZ01498.1 fructosamine kinase [Actinoplanes sp. NBRC 103695]